MEEKKITIYEAITMTANMLSKIEVPAELVEKIGIPIARSINNLRICADTIAKAQQDEEKETEKDGADNGE